MSELHTNPNGQYKPELLLLAPAAGEDANTLSLVAQFIELGVAIELDEHWRLPTAPPRNLSAYKACLFPDTGKEAYDAELNKFFADGGHLFYLKYYPTEVATASGPPHFITFARDVYMFGIANAILEGGLAVHHPEFRRTMASRSPTSILAELRAGYFKAFGSRSLEVWRDWGDPEVTRLYANLELAERTGDDDWLELVRYCLGKMVESRDLARGGGEVRLPGVVSSNSVMFAGMLMDMGDHFAWPELSAFGLELGRQWLESAYVKDGLIRSRYMRYIWGESCAPLPCLYWMTRVTGDGKYAAQADALVEAVVARNQRTDGIWDAYTSDEGIHGAAWSRGNAWHVLFMTLALRALAPKSESARRMHKALIRSYEGLARHQDCERGVWHLVIDEPETRVESSGTAGFVYCHDKLRESGVLDGRHDEMIERAFTGLKRLHYRGGLAGCCRGTATGVPEYYRTRPIGYFDRSLFGACVAGRCARPKT